jgi:type IV secretory pathway TrbD component
VPDRIGADGAQRFIRLATGGIAVAALVRLGAFLAAGAVFVLLAWIVAVGVCMFLAAPAPHAASA